MFKLLFAGSFGAALAYFLDPDTGRRRRNVWRDRSLACGRDALGFLGRFSRYYSGRFEGLLHDFRTTMAGRTQGMTEQVHELRERVGMSAEHATHIASETIGQTDRHDIFSSGRNEQSPDPRRRGPLTRRQATELGSSIDSNTTTETSTSRQAA
ncbi:MAG: hypothetical protein QOF51_4094 [Chloroflexota bacterium]|nr:hypothetical protein [Chloroflexota bacterium]